MTDKQHLIDTLPISIEQKRLYEAAPELLEALQELWSASFERNAGREGLIRLQNAQMRASDILAKAKGEV